MSNATPDTADPTKVKDTSGTSGPTLGGTGLLDVRTPAQLRGIAESQVNTDISGQVSPLQGQVGTLQGREGRAVGSIQQMFGSILPSAADAAARVQGAYGSAEQSQQSIMAAATQRMNDLKQSRAQQAQALAQEMGGPVSVGEFTSSMGFEPEALANLGAGQQLHTLQFGLADVGEANAFAGRVLPLVQTEETAKAKAFYEDQISELEKNIAAIQSTRGSKINSAVNDLLLQERTFQLQKAQGALAEVQSQHDWAATQRQLHQADKQFVLDKQKSKADIAASKATIKQEAKRIGMTEKQWALQVAGVTGSYKGKPTLEKQSLNAQEKQQAAALDMTNKEFGLKKDQLNKDSALASKRLAVTEKATWAQYLDMAINPEPGKSVTTTIAVPVPAAAAITGKVGDAYADPSSPTGYSRLVKETQPGPSMTPLSDPNDLVDYLVSHNVPRPSAVNMVRARLQIPNWKYGQRDPHKKIPPEKLGPPAPGKKKPGPYGK